MKTKPLLCPERLRHVPRQFSWIDQRLVGDRHLKGRPPRALTLYLFLCTVADAQGSSYYSDESTRGMLAFSPEELRAARTELVTCGLIAYRSPFYQVLSLDPVAVAASPTPSAESRMGEARSVGDILRLMMKVP
jgi:hypothetical protein